MSSEHASPDRNEQWLTPAEVAAMFRVNTKTVARWAQEGKLRAARTPGGHRRFSAHEMRVILGDPPPAI
jgi:excisionase family DNA binding protein